MFFMVLILTRSWPVMVLDSSSLDDDRLDHSTSVLHVHTAEAVGIGFYDSPLTALKKLIVRERQRSHVIVFCCACACGKRSSNITVMIAQIFFEMWL